MSDSFDPRCKLSRAGKCVVVIALPVFCGRIRNQKMVSFFYSCLVQKKGGEKNAVAAKAPFMVLSQLCSLRTFRSLSLSIWLTFSLTHIPDSEAFIFSQVCLIYCLVKRFRKEMNENRERKNESIKILAAHPKEKVLFSSSSIKKAKTELEKKCIFYPHSQNCIGKHFYHTSSVFAQIMREREGLILSFRTKWTMQFFRP